MSEPIDFSLPIRYAADCEPCPCGCGELWCDLHQDHYYACPCPGPHSEEDMPKLIITSVKVNMTAEDWELYIGRRGVAGAAAAINRAIEKSVKLGLDRSDTETAVHVVMDKYEDLGAADTEPRYHLQELLNEVFPRAS